mmetsp:Transcript_109855/g.309822  ORF Transcript_109855/g.309822 Transcript_109855/m.309822 type:complete len:233 (+) Transcript_109855:233-931(+)
MVCKHCNNPLAQQTTGPRRCLYRTRSELWAQSVSHSARCRNVVIRHPTFVDPLLDLAAGGKKNRWTLHQLLDGGEGSARGNGLASNGSLINTQSSKEQRGHFQDTRNPFRRVNRIAQLCNVALSQHVKRCLCLVGQVFRTLPLNDGNNLRLQCSMCFRGIGYKSAWPAIENPRDELLVLNEAIAVLVHACDQLLNHCFSQIIAGRIQAAQDLKQVRLANNAITVSVKAPERP